MRREDSPLPFAQRPRSKLSVLFGGMVCPAASPQRGERLLSFEFEGETRIADDELLVER